MRSLGIPLLLPDVNRSEATFTLEKMADGHSAIRFGWATIKSVGRAAVDPLIEERNANGPIQSANDLAERLDSKTINRRALEALARAGAFDSIESRGAMVAAAEDIIKRARRAQELRDSGQTSMFDLFGTEVATPTPTVEIEEDVEATRHEQLNWERELLGAYISEHPLQAAMQALQGRVDAQLSELTEDMVGNTQTVAGLVTSVRLLTTKKGDQFAAVMLEDLSGTAEVTVWPDQWASTKQIWTPNQIVVTTVSIRTRMDRLTLAMQSVEPWGEQGSAASALPDSAAPGALGGSGTVVVPPIKQAPAPPWMSKPRRPLLEPSETVEPTPLPPAEPVAARTASALWITIDESGDEEADVELMEQLEGGLKAMKLMHRGADPVFLRIRSGDRVAVLRCSDEWLLQANDQVVQLVSNTLGERGSVTIAEPPERVVRAGDSAAGL